MPNRIIKESICTSDSIDGLTWFEEVLFYRLIVNCDDYGRFDGRPAIIKNRLFPLKESLTARAVSEAINRLASAGMVALYEFEGKPYLYLPTWNCHQSVRAKRSKYPSPDDAGNAPAGEEQEADGTDKQHESICKHMNSYESICPRNPIQSESNPNPNPIREADAGNAPAGEESAPPPADPDLAKVINLYLNRVNALPSSSCIEELKSYTKLLGADVCCKAIEVALDDKKSSWSYIKAILQSYSRDGVRSLADVQEREARREAEKASIEKRRNTMKPNQVVAGTFPSSKPVDIEKVRRIAESM
ncbi:MAG: DnaD domain protein [Faecousia sp.]